MTEILKPDSPVRLALDEGTERARAYMLRAPGVYDKAQLNRAVQSRGARAVHPAEVLAALRDGVVQVLAGPADADVLDGILAALDRFSAAAEADPKLWFLGDAAVAEALDLARPHFPRLAELEAARDWYWDVLGIETCRLFVTGAEGLDFPVARAGLPPALPDETIMRIPEGDRLAIVLRVRQLLSLDPVTEKNSDSPSPTQPIPANSTTGPNGGTSARKTQPRTAKAGTSKPSASAG